MSEPIVVTDTTLEEHARGAKPLVLLVTTGEGIRGDFATAFKNAIAQYPDILFARLNPAENPAAAARFGAAEKPLLIGLVGGEEIVRRFRPWGTDLAPLVEELRAKATLPQAQSAPAADPIASSPVEMESVMEPVSYEDKPVNVTDATFQADVIDQPLPVLVDFWAEWCGPCRAVAPALEKLAKEFAGQVRIAKVNVDENPALSQAFRIMSIPNLMMVKNKTMVFNQPGALPEPVLRDLIKQLIALEVPAPDEVPQEQPAVES